METLNIFENGLNYFSVGFIGGVGLAYIAKIINTLWASALKFF